MILLFTVDINECSSNPCLNGGSCTDQVNGYVCSCQPGYAGDRCQTSKIDRLEKFLASINFAVKN